MLIRRNIRACDQQGAERAFPRRDTRQGHALIWRGAAQVARFERERRIGPRCLNGSRSDSKSSSKVHVIPVVSNVRTRTVPARARVPSPRLSVIVNLGMSLSVHLMRSRRERSTYHCTASLPWVDASAPYFAASMTSSLMRNASSVACGPEIRPWPENSD